MGEKGCDARLGHQTRVDCRRRVDVVALVSLYRQYWEWYDVISICKLVNIRLILKCHRLSSFDQTVRNHRCLAAPVALPACHASALLANPMGYTAFARATEVFPPGPRPHRVCAILPACCVLHVLLHPGWISRKTHQRQGCHIRPRQHFLVRCD